MDMKDFNAFLADYLKRYKGISVYQEDQNGPCFYQWNYEDGCLMLGCKQMYEATAMRISRTTSSTSSTRMSPKTAPSAATT